MRFVFCGQYPSGFYVYVHRKLTTGEVFYVGKGVNKRCTSPHRNNKFWKTVAEKHGVLVEIVASGLQEWYAFELEEQLINYYGKRIDNSGTLTNICDGGNGVKNYVFTDEVKSKISQNLKGLSNGRADKNVYSFFNAKTGERYSGTRSEFCDRYKINPKDIFKGLCHSVKFWTVDGISDLSKVRGL